MLDKSIITLKTVCVERESMLTLVTFGEAWRGAGEEFCSWLLRHQEKSSGPRCVGLEVTVHGGPLPSRFGGLTKEMAQESVCSTRVHNLKLILRTCIKQARQGGLCRNLSTREVDTHLGACWPASLPSQPVSGP